MSNKLEINGLECIRDNRPIFKDINFSVKSNQTMLVRGKNGSGKTSLLRVLAGYIKNYSGNILFNGKIPEPSLILEQGQCETLVPVLENKSISSLLSFTQCACQTSFPIHPSSSMYCPGVKPNILLEYSTSSLFSAK